jgi:hypothetical protein
LLFVSCLLCFFVLLFFRFVFGLFLLFCFCCLVFGFFACLCLVFLLVFALPQLVYVRFLFFFVFCYLFPVLFVPFLLVSCFLVRLVSGFSRFFLLRICVLVRKAAF